MKLERTTDRIITSNLPQPDKEAGKELALWLADLPEDEGRFLPLSHVSTRFAETFEFEDLLAALSVLARSEFAILDVSGYFNEDDGPIVLTPVEYREAIRSGVLAHPESGDHIGDPKDVPQLYFALKP